MGYNAQPITVNGSSLAGAIFLWAKFPAVEEFFMSRQLGFWSVFAIVTGSQIGSGVFISPATLAPFGLFGIAGWLISGFGALALALVFAELCARFPKTGGPHVFVLESFGSNWAFFTGWTYWVVSFVSSTAVIVTSIGYLSPLLPFPPGPSHLLLEFILLFSIVGINLRGVKTAGNAEFFLTILKFIPLFVLPALALYHFRADNFMISPNTSQMSLAKILGHVTLLTMWGFIGVESATASAGAVIDARKTIPRAIVLGTITVAAVYIFSSVSIMGLIPGSVLMESRAPFVDAAQYLSQGNWHMGISLIASIVCIGTINAWILTSGQIALGLAEDKILPSSFLELNKHKAPIWGILVSSFGIAPLLIMTNSPSLAKQITDIIDISVVSFLFVYLICSLGLLRVLKREKAAFTGLPALAGIIAIIFCIFVISQTPFSTLLIAALFTLSGLPLFIWKKRKNNKHN